jgi:hypothetical protein
MENVFFISSTGIGAAVTHATYSRHTFNGHERYLGVSEFRDDRDRDKYVQGCRDLGWVEVDGEVFNGYRAPAKPANVRYFIGPDGRTYKHNSNGHVHLPSGVVEVTREEFDGCRVEPDKAAEFRYFITAAGHAYIYNVKAQEVQCLCATKGIYIEKYGPRHDPYHRLPKGGVEVTREVFDGRPADSVLGIQPPAKADGRYFVFPSGITVAVFAGGTVKRDLKHGNLIAGSVRFDSKKEYHDYLLQLGGCACYEVTEEQFEADRTSNSYDSVLGIQPPANGLLMPEIVKSKPKPEPKHESNWVDDLYHDRRAAALRAGKGYPNPDDHTDLVKMTAHVHSLSMRGIILDRMKYLEFCSSVHPFYASEYRDMTGSRPCFKYVRDEVETKRFHQAMDSRRPETIAEYLKYLFAIKDAPLPVIGQYGGGRFSDNTNFFRGYLDRSGWYAICTWDGWMYDRVYREHVIGPPITHEAIKEGPQPMSELIDGVINVIKGVNAVRNAVKPKE